MKRRRMLLSLVGSLLLVIGTIVSAQPAGAHKQEVHQTITDEALNLYSNAEMLTYMNDIRNGAWDEDERDHVFDRSGACLWIDHFWDADLGPEFPVWTPGCEDGKNSWQKAQILWGMAVGEHAAGHLDRAYEYLGHVAHLLADQSVPAHVHADLHPGLGVDDDSYEEWMAANDSLTGAERADLIAEGPVEIPAPLPETIPATIPADKRPLYYLFYTMNQIGDFFASDGFLCGYLDAGNCNGDLDDYRGGWMSEVYTELGMDAVTSPLTTSQLEDNDDGDYGDNSNHDGDLGVIRQHSYLYAIRATAALYRLFDQVTSSRSALTVVIEEIEAQDAHEEPSWGADFFVNIDIGGHWFTNEGNQILDNDHIYPHWAFGADVGNKLDQPAVPIMIALLDEDESPNPDDLSDINPTDDARTLRFRVHFSAGELTGDVTGRAGETITSVGGENDRSQIKFRVLLPNIVPIVYAGNHDPVSEGDDVTLNSSFKDANAEDTHTATVNWGDSTPVESGTVVEPDFTSSPAKPGTVSGCHVYADNGLYTVEVCVEDNYGAKTCDSFEVTVNNAPPVVEAGANQTVDEGDEVELAPATFTDPGTGDTHTATVNWGDGTPDEVGSVEESAGSGTISASHVYADNGVYAVEVCVADDDDAETCDSFVATVNNAAPAVAGMDQTIAESAALLLEPAATFTDPGTGDTHTATIAWGDGTPVESGTVAESPGSGAVSGSHVYDDNGNYTVEVCVTDDDGATTCDTFVVTVTNVSPVPAIAAIRDELGHLVGSGVVRPALAGLNLDLTGSFHDQGTQDTHTASIRWGEATTAGVVTEVLGPPGSANGMDGSVTSSYAYQSAGDYTVELAVTDDDGGVGVTTVEITVMDGCGGALTWASNQLAGHLQDPSLTLEAAKHIEKAIEHLVGNKDGQGKNGAIDKCAKGDLNPAQEKVRDAIKELEKAEEKQIGLNLADEKDFLALMAKSVAVTAIKAAEPLADKKDEMHKLEEAKALVANGDALLASSDFEGAVEHGYRKAVERVKGIK